jgi:hypothetical protein
VNDSVSRISDLRIFHSKLGSKCEPVRSPPHGELGFNIGDFYTERATRDSKKRRLEDWLNLFIENLVQRALYGEDETR